MTTIGGVRLSLMQKNSKVSQQEVTRSLSYVATLPVFGETARPVTDPAAAALITLLGIHEPPGH